MIKKILEEKFELIYSIYLVLIFLRSSALVVDYTMIRTVVKVMILGIYLICFIRILVKYKEYLSEFDVLGWKKKSNLEKFAIIIVIIFLISISINFLLTGNRRMITLVIMLLAGYKTDYKKIIKYTMAIQITLTSIITLMSMLGITQNYAVPRGDNKFRYSMGLGYPTSLSQMVMFASLLYLYIQKFNVTYNMLFVIQVLNNLTFMITDSKAEFLFLELIIVVTLLNKINFISKFKNYFKKILAFFAYTFSIYPIISFCVSMSYNMGGIFLKLNSILSNRLKQTYLVIKSNGLKIFGENIELVGYGIGEGTNYKGVGIVSNFVDNEYIQILIKEGILAAIFFVVILHIFLIILNKQKKYYEIFLCSVYLMFGILNPRIITLMYCPILFIIIPTFLQYFKENRKIKDVNDGK